MKLRKLATPKLTDIDAERVRRAHEDAISELQTLPALGMRIIAGIELRDGIDTPIAHGLGRAPAWVRESCVRGAVTTGRVEEVRSGRYDRARVVVLKATGYGATVTADVVVL